MQARKMRAKAREETREWVQRIGVCQEDLMYVFVSSNTTSTKTATTMYRTHTQIFTHTYLHSNVTKHAHPQLASLCLSIFLSWIYMQTYVIEICRRSETWPLWCFSGTRGLECFTGQDPTLDTSLRNIRVLKMMDQAHNLT